MLGTCNNNNHLMHGYMATNPQQTKTKSWSLDKVYHNEEIKEERVYEDMNFSGKKTRPGKHEIREQKE